MNAEGEKKCVTIQYVQLYEEGIDKGCLYDGRTYTWLMDLLYGRSVRGYP